VEEALPLDGIVIVTGLGEVTLTSLGATPSQPADRVTVEVRPFTDDSIMLADCDAPGESVIVAGEG
jgi:hypothetical protein